MPSVIGNKLDFTGRTAIVTGGSQGIGLGVAERLLASGANVSIWAVNAGRLAQAAKALEGGNRLQTLEADIGDLSAIEPQRKQSSTATARSMCLSTMPASPVPTSRCGNSRRTFLRK